MDLLGFLIGWGYPFLAVLRGRPFPGPFLAAWGGMLLWSVVFSLGVPGVVNLFSHEFAREMQSNWLPTPQGIPLIVIIGWWPPLVAALLALGARWLLRTLWPTALVRLDPAAYASGIMDQNEKPQS